MFDGTMLTTEIAGVIVLELDNGNTFVPGNFF
jgi:hypothetical protein